VSESVVVIELRTIYGVTFT